MDVVAHELDEPSSLKRKINVLVLESTFVVGGVENLVLNVFPRLDPAQFNVTVCALYSMGPMGPQFVARGCHVEHSLIRKKYDPRALLRLRQIIRRDRIDLIYLVTQPLTLFWGLLAAKTHGLPLACVIGNTLQIGDHPKLQMYPLLLPFVDAIVAQADLQRDHLVRNLNFPARLMKVVHNGIDRHAYVNPVVRSDKLRSLGLPATSRIVGVNGRMVKLKGVDVLLQAATRLISRNPDLQFVLAGTGPEVANLERLAGELGLADRVHFLGFRDDLPELLQIYDVAVLPSRTEAFPMVVLEYMAAGRSIVATNVGSVSEVIENETNGLLVDSENPEQLERAITRLLEDQELARRCSLGALRTVSTRFTLEQAIQRTESLITELVRKRQP